MDALRKWSVQRRTQRSDSVLAQKDEAAKANPMT